jgi:hypothetical protein
MVALYWASNFQSLSGYLPSVLEEEKRFVRVFFTLTKEVSTPKFI